MPHDLARTRRSLQSLQPVLELAERERDDAAAALRQAERALERAEQQASQISDYRSETQARWHAQFRQGSSITLVHCYQDFVSRLHGAEAHSDAGVSAAQSRRDAARAVLQAAELRLASVGRLRDRREAVLRLGLERRDQRQTDEAATRAALRERPDGQSPALRARAEEPVTAHGELATRPAPLDPLGAPAMMAQAGTMAWLKATAATLPTTLPTTTASTVASTVASTRPGAPGSLPLSTAPAVPTPLPAQMPPAARALPTSSPALSPAPPRDALPPQPRRAGPPVPRL